jgi:Fe-S-cluster-containing hydrogenase component 2
MNTTRKIIEIDEALCNGCGQCVPSCHEGAIQIVNGKAKLVAERYCDGLGACLGHCPTGALQVVEREADAFDEQAVEVHLSAQKPVHSGCPSARMQQFASRPQVHASAASTPSELSHWPVQVHLVPPHAPFLEEADLLVAADCVPVAYPDFHRDLLQGRKVMIGCPKFDDLHSYLLKFAEIFANVEIRSVTVAVMQVPCCQSLPVVVQKALEMAGKHVPIEKVVISLEGEIVQRKALVA